MSGWKRIGLACLTEGKYQGTSCELLCGFALHPCTQCGDQKTNLLDGTVVEEDTIESNGEGNEIRGTNQTEPTSQRINDYFVKGLLEQMISVAW